MTFIERNIYTLLKKHLPKKQATVLTGMRRTGKTTLLKQLMKDSDIKQKLFFDLERIDNRELFSEKNYEHIIHALELRGTDFSKKVLIGIDEIQLQPNLPSVVKYLMDNYDIKFVLTGSSSYYLKNKFSESMAGRKKIFEVFPLNFGEFLKFKEVAAQVNTDFLKFNFVRAEYDRLRPYYDEFIEFGGFPEVVLDATKEGKEDILKDIISSYINLDLMALQDIQKSSEVFNLIKMLAVRIGSRLDISKLSILTGIPRQKLQNYLDLLEQSYFIHTIPVAVSKPDSAIKKARKLYFCDTGLANQVATLDSGSQFENTVFNQLKQHGEVSYFALKNGQEIDFVLNAMAFEVKETGIEPHRTKAELVAKKINLSDVFIISRNINSSFKGLLWGGFIH